MKPRSIQATLTTLLICLALGAAATPDVSPTSGPAFEEPSQLVETRTILVVGDSISAGLGIQREDGWVELLAARLRSSAAGYTVVNASISGDTTAGGLVRLPNALEVHAPEVVIIELGGNDGLRGYPTENIRRNLMDMVALARAGGASVVLLGMEIPPNYGPRYTGAFRQVFTDVAEATEIPFVPFLLDGVATDETLMQRDGIHPTASAQGQLLDNVWKVLAPLLGR